MEKVTLSKGKNKTVEKIKLIRRSILAIPAMLRWKSCMSRVQIEEPERAEESQKLYCPYRDCSILLPTDCQQLLTQKICPACQRSFCARCQVPWHPEFTCKEFMKLNGKKKRGLDLMVEKIAKKEKWRKCPGCKFFVEKTGGWNQITCRCSYEFCYKCGSKWRFGHFCG